MGLWEKIKSDLKLEFSLFQFMEVLGMTEEDKREARNLLNQLYHAGKIVRVSANMYRKL
ncbi:MAG TPA: hypothetical protein VMV49_15695 [Candidatus Deferrimicrobium sp.]|nr:hypothetical protein [Candidatus Deferrimicrobium sp.]